MKEGAEVVEKEAYLETRRCRLMMEGEYTSPGRFEVVAITAGPANGWQFDAEVLKESIGLWEGVHCFVDHGLASRSVRDIAGILRHPTWDEQLQGIRAVLESFGPAGELLSGLGRQAVGMQPPSLVGFSADIFFKHRGKRVEKITRVMSVDLVYNPARGGAFLRLLNQIEEKKNKKGDKNMQENEQLTGDGDAVETREQFNLKENNENALMQVQLAETAKVRQQMCTWALEAGLNAAHLPKPVSDRLRRQFQERIFEAAELQTAIEDQRTMLAELEAAEVVQGPGRVSNMVDTTDRLQAAVDDLFGLPRDERLKGVSVTPLSGIRELYLTLTGDHELHGGYHPERAQLATTADFTGLVKNALNKIVVNTWDELGRIGYDWWQAISVQEHFSTLHSITGTLVGTVSDLPAISEGAEYTELVVGDSPETASFTKYGGYIPLTLELIDRDETRKLRMYARELASAGMRKISKKVAEIFTANAGIGPTMADTGALFNATAVTTAGGHGNLLTTALSASQWDIVSQAVYKQPMLVKNEAGSYGIGPAMGVNPKYILVPRAMQKTAMEICTGALVREENYVFDNVMKGTAVPVVVPEWTDANNWAAVCDPRIAPSIYVGERFGLRPEVFVAGDELSPAVFMNDEHRLKVRHFLAVWVNDFRPLHKSNVA